MDKIEHSVVIASFIGFCSLVFDLAGVKLENGCAVYLIKESTLRGRQDPLH